MNGLRSAEAEARLERYGPNRLPERPPLPWWRRLLRQFASPLIYILIVALVFDLVVWASEGAVGWPVESLAITIILALNAALGLYQERRSEAALAHLAALAGAHAWVLRDDQFVHLPTHVIVPGDVVRLEAGDRVPADATIGDAQSAMLDESVLTGESVPVDRAVGEEVLSGTLLVRGRMLIDVTRTGAESAMGRLAHMLGAIEVGQTPLERRVDRLGRQLARGVLALALVIVVAGIAAEGWGRAAQMVVFAVALAVAAVPEGLPAVLTVALSLGVERMARRRAVVRRLAAVEALGSVDVIATDKTGTLTENRMDVRGLDAEDEAGALRAMVFANDADPASLAGDPLDVGLLRFAASRGVDVAAVRAASPVRDTRPFDSAWKFARTTVEEDGGVVSYVKGAPEAVLGRCALDAEARAAWQARAERHAEEGLRVIALASAPDVSEEQLRLLGLALFWDPPRPEVADAMARAQAAGIRVVMITGDHPATARAIATQIGLRDVETSVYARVRPEQKLEIVESLQRDGCVVAMTGDGVNDAPALKRSDVGVAMGQRGSDVSREVADLVLLDDNFATIVTAVEEGRNLYESIQAVLRFLFSTNLSEILLLVGGLVLSFFLGLREASGGLLLPLTAAQILWLNLMTDGLPALALTLDRRPGVMEQAPRPASAPLLDRPALIFVVGAALTQAALALLILGVVPWFGFSHEQARATAFHTMAISQLMLTYPARRTWLVPRPNRLLHAAVLAGIAIQVGAAVVPVMSIMLGGVAVPVPLWLIVAAAASTAWLVGSVLVRLAWRRPVSASAA